MGERGTTVDAIILVLGIALIVFTALGTSRKRSGRRKAAEGQTTALIGIAIWLGCLGVALYLIFG